MNDKFTVEKDEDSLYVYDEDDEEYYEYNGAEYVVIHKEAAEQGWTAEDVVCRCNELKEADRIAALLNEHGLTTAKQKS